MNAEKHFLAGTQVEADQSKLDPAANWWLLIEGCYMAAHHCVLAGAEWRGVAHPQDHKHTRDAGLLAQAAAPQTVDDAWHTLEVLRPGRVYGAQGNGASSTKARESFHAIKEWAEAARPS